jgi:DNA (cytosine-5)-methyltransferase 1
MRFSVNFSILNRTPMRDIREFLVENDEVSCVYDVTQPSVLSVIGKTGIKRLLMLPQNSQRLNNLEASSTLIQLDNGSAQPRNQLDEVSCVYDVTQPSVLSVIGKTGIKRATVIKDFAY